METDAVSREKDEMKQGGNEKKDERQRKEIAVRCFWIFLFLFSKGLEGGGV